MPLRELTEHKVPKPITDTEVQLRIVPTMARWPSPDVAKTVARGKTREAAETLRGLVRVVDEHCLEAERNTELTDAAIARRRESGRSPSPK